MWSKALISYSKLFIIQLLCQTIKQRYKYMLPRPEIRNCETTSIKRTKNVFRMRPVFFFSAGTPLVSIRTDWFRKRVGIVSQEPVLFAKTIGENIAYGRNATQEEVSSQRCLDDLPLDNYSSSWIIAPLLQLKLLQACSFRSFLLRAAYGCNYQGRGTVT